MKEAAVSGGFFFVRTASANDYLSWVEMLVNLVFRVEPRVLTTAMIATEMPAAMRPYSMAVAPDSFFRNATILDMCYPLRKETVAAPYRPAVNNAFLRSVNVDMRD